MHNAVHDSLSGLPNRELFLDRLAIAAKRATLEPLVRPSLLFVDIDKFKSANSAFGLVVGDSLLLTVARRLGRNLGPQDTLARIGGDQFALLLLSQTDPRELAMLAEQVRRAVRSPITIAGQEIVLTASIGISIYDGPDEDPAELLREAEIAMYRAKRSGSDRIEIFNAEMRTEQGRPRGARGRVARRHREEAAASWSISRSSTCRPRRWPASRRCCAGSIRGSACSTRRISCRWRRSPISSSSSAPMCSRAPYARCSAGSASCRGPTSRCLSASMSQAGSCSGRSSSTRCAIFSAAPSSPRDRCGWRSPNRSRWRIPRRQRGAGTAARPPAPGCRSTISAPGTHRCPISRNSPSTPSRSIARSCRLGAERHRRGGVAVHHRARARAREESRRRRRGRPKTTWASCARSAASTRKGFYYGEPMAERDLLQLLKVVRRAERQSSGGARCSASASSTRRDRARRGAARNRGHKRTAHRVCRARPAAERVSGQPHGLPPPLQPPARTAAEAVDRREGGTPRRRRMPLTGPPAAAAHWPAAPRRLPMMPNAVRLNLPPTPLRPVPPLPTATDRTAPPPPPLPNGAKPGQPSLRHQPPPLPGGARPPPAGAQRPNLPPLPAAAQRTSAAGLLEIAAGYPGEPGSAGR